jgi:hypothetical protein
MSWDKFCAIFLPTLLVTLIAFELQRSYPSRFAECTTGKFHLACAIGPDARKTLIVLVITFRTRTKLSGTSIQIRRTRRHTSPLKSSSHAVGDYLSSRVTGWHIASHVTYCHIASRVTCCCHTSPSHVVISRHAPYAVFTHRRHASHDVVTHRRHASRIAFTEYGVEVCKLHIRCCKSKPVSLKQKKYYFKRSSFFSF